jgi:hypothetical protein
MAQRTKSKRSGLVVLLLLAIAGVLAVKTGWAGFGWAQVRSAVYPRTDSLLEWIPADAQGVAIVDPHQIRLKALGGEGSIARTWLERVRGDIKKAAGVDLVFDVDKVALTMGLIVMSGRFDGEKIAAKLAEYQYTKAEHGERSYLVRAGEDALMVVDDDVLVYGDEDTIKGSIDAKSGASLAKSGAVIDRLAQIGWNHPLLATFQLGSDHPSLRSMITGSTGPRAVSFSVQGNRGIDVRAAIEAATPSAASELAKLLDEKRANVADLQAMTGPALGAQLATVARDATINADPVTGQVAIGVHVSSEALDAAIKSAEQSAPLTEMYKTVRIVQLLTPSP